MATIEKKIWPQYFELVKSGRKKYEFRLADFDVKEGDTLILKEWDPDKMDYTGREITKKAGYTIKFDLDDFVQKEEIEKKGFYIIQFE